MTEIEYDNLPERVKAIVETYDDNENLYEECHRIKIELEHIGWTCDYDLSGEIFDVRKKLKIESGVHPQFANILNSFANAMVIGTKPEKK